LLDSNSFSKAYFRFFAIHVRIINNIQKYIFVFALVKLRVLTTVKVKKGIKMKVQIYGSQQCPGCVEAKKALSEKGADFEFIDLSENLYNLKRFLAFREQEEIYKPFREQALKKDYPDEGRIGIPCFVLEDGERTMDLDYVLTKV
jgi:hypothetical protein